MKYPLASNSWSDEEVHAIQDVIQSDMYTMGSKVEKFEKEFAREMGVEHAIMVNSGSSANLLMLTAAKIQYKWENCNVIVPAVGWSTTYSPVHQIGAKLNFVDISLSTMNIDPMAVKMAINPYTKAILAVNLLGNPADLDSLRQIADEHGLALLEDNCESFGATVDGQFTGTMGDMGTYSFFFSHHLQTMEGGMIVTNDDRLANILKSLRAHGWIRDMTDVNEWYNKKGDPFKEPFIFALPGYSVRPLEMSGAIGSVQLKKWKENVAQRQSNAKLFKELFDPKEWCQLQSVLPGHKSSWYGFAMLTNDRDNFVSHLMQQGVQLRPIMTGNFLNQPVMKFYKDAIVPSDGCPIAEMLDKRGFFIGNHPHNITEDLLELHELMVTIKEATTL